MVSAPSGTAAAILRRPSRSTRCTASGRVAWYSSTVAGRSPMRATRHGGGTRATGRRRQVAPNPKGTRTHVGIKESGDRVRGAGYPSAVAGRSPMRPAWQVGVTRAKGGRRKVAPTHKGAGMHVGIKEGGAGAGCGTRRPVTAYAEQVNRREAQIAQQNPDV